MSDNDLKMLLSCSQENNGSNGITGMLLYIDKKFIQVIEGQKEEVIKLFDKISIDPRHKKVSIILEGDLEKRNFKEWSMGFKTLNNEEFKELPAFRDIETLFGSRSMINQNHTALTFLKLFYEKNYQSKSVAAKAS